MWRVSAYDRTNTMLVYKTVRNLSAVAGMIATWRVRQGHRVTVTPSLNPDQRVQVDRLIEKFARG